MSEQKEMVRVSGHVKWFDAAKGYGFITTELGDVLIHSKVLRASGYPPNIVADALVECECERADRGYRANRVTSVNNTSVQDQRVGMLWAKLDQIGVDISIDDIQRALALCALRLDPAL